MTSEVEDYLRRARDAEEQARAAKSEQLKRHWENAALGWRILAEKDERRGVSPP
jgi:hypothetical protein